MSSRTDAAGPGGPGKDADEPRPGGMDRPDRPGAEPGGPPTQVLPAIVGPVGEPAVARDPAGVAQRTGAGQRTGTGPAAPEPASSLAEADTPTSILPAAEDEMSCHEPQAHEIGRHETGPSGPAPGPADPGPGRGAWRLLRAAWIVLLAVVLAAGIWAAWLLAGTNQLARNSANRLISEYFASCAAGGSQQVVGVLSLPGLGSTAWPIVAGADQHALSQGLAWYRSSARPGEVGNTVVAGYRITHGEPFRHLLDLGVGAKVRVETCDHVLTYTIEVAPRDLTVSDHADWVTQAVPGDPGRLPTASMITLITSQDLLPTHDRSVGFGRLDQVQPRG